MLIFQPYKLPCYDFGFGTVDEIITVSSKGPVLQHDDEVDSTADSTVLNILHHCSSTEQVEVPTPSSKTVQLNADEKEIPFTALEKVEASPSCSKTVEDEVKTSTLSFQKKNDNSKVNIIYK